MLIDTHAHLDFSDYSSDRDSVLARAFDAGVTHVVNIGIDLKTSKESIALARMYDNVFATVGLHPHDASREKDDASFSEFEALLKSPKVIAIGEIGLDYFRDISCRKDQEYVFRRFLSLHKASSLPLILHARDSYDDLFRILKEELGDGPLRGVMHCFSGDQKALECALQFGLFISFTGPVTYKKNDDLRAIVKNVPDNLLLCETDAPYLSPQSKRGTRNEPAFMIETVDKIAELRGVRREDIARITTHNAQQLFGIKIADEKPAIVYKIRDSVYINTTTGCTNECVFCVKFFEDFVKGHNLRISQDPTVEETLAAINAYAENFKEVTFCGFGEPLLRLDFIKAVALELKKKNISVRIDTNGHGNLIHKRNILPELEGLIDEVCVSLNTPDSELYTKICKPHFSGDVYGAVKDFIREAKRFIPRVVVTFLDMPGIDVEEMKRIAVQELGVEYRLRHYNAVG
jgi:TatD DNase family protein